MGSLSQFFADSAIKTVKDTVKIANDMLQSFSFSDIGKAMDEAQTRLKDEFSRFIGQVRSYSDRYSIDIPYDPQKEDISYTIENNTIYITVKAKDNSSNLNKIVDLPEDVDSQEMTHSYDSEKHIMTFKFKKITE